MRVKKRQVFPVLAVVVAAGFLGCDSTPGTVGAQSSKDVAIRVHDDHAEVLVNGRPFTAFHYHSKWDKPFLHPLRTKSGVVVSRGYPVSPLPGDSEDHVWHRGIWFGHGDINGEDFWREQGREKTSWLVLHGAPDVSSGGARGGATLTVLLNMQSARSGIIGSIREAFTFRTAEEGLLIDTVIEVLADRGVALKFGDTDDGGFGMRLREEFRQDRGARLTNSEGFVGTENIWGKSAKWVHYSAKVDGKAAGVAVLDHPSNLRHPTTWHARGYGLFAANPFGLRSFTRDKTRDGSFTIPEGGKQAFRYRVVVMDEETPAAKLDGMFADYAAGK
jgi:hypothetical protein